MSRNSDLDDFGGQWTDEQMKQFQREFQKKKLEEHEQQKAARAREALGLLQSEEWNPKKFQEETDRQEAEWRKQKAEADKIERGKIEHANAVSLISQNPRYIPTPANYQNIKAYLAEHHLQPTPFALQAAYNHLQPILELKPEPAQPPTKVFSESELYKMPLERGDDWSLDDNPLSLEQAIYNNANDLKKLENF